jgi:NADPH:quinone reductase-like Zn-dependent oxidoreductase
MMGTKGEFPEFLPFFASGLLRPVVDRVLPLGQARVAHELVESRQVFGKIVLDPTMS